MNFSRLYIPATALLVFGYPMTTVAASLAGLPLGDVNIYLKALYAVMFAISLLATLARFKLRLPASTLPLAGFFILFGVRLIYDIYVRGLYPPLSSPNYIITYFFPLTMLPALSIALAFKSRDLDAIYLWVHTILLLSAVMIFVQFLQSGSQFMAAIASERLEIRGEGEATARLSAITIGIVGSSLAAISVAQLSLSSHRQNKVRLLLASLGVLLGLGALFLAGSRGPMLAFLVAMLFLMLGIANARRPSARSTSAISKRTVLLFAGMIAGAVVVVQNADTMFLALSRLMNTFSEFGASGQSEARAYIALDAWRSFASAPLLGHGYLALGHTAYAHNSILEALMATGIFGGALFLFGLGMVVFEAWRALTLRDSPEAFLLAPVVISMIIMSFFAASLSQSPEIWITVFLFHSITSHRGRRSLERSGRTRTRRPKTA